MKKLWAFFAIMLTFTLAMEPAHAKRMGSGKSFGNSYQTAPSRSNADAAPAQRRQDAPAPAQSPRKNLMGGLLGGLLVGGLFAALFAGGAFDGLQMMDILIIAALAFGIFMVIRAVRRGRAAGHAPLPASGPQPAYAGAGMGSATPTPAVAKPSLFDSLNQNAAKPAAGGGGNAGAAVPFKLPLGFDEPSFLSGAKEHYRILQDAWNRNDLAKIQEYTAPKLYAELQAERAGLTTHPQTVVLSVDAELVRANQQFGIAEVSIRFSGRYSDASEGVSNEPFVDIWHLERDYTKVDAPWFVTGIRSE